MQVAIDETGDDSLAREIDDSRAIADQTTDVRIGADGKNPIFLDGNCLQDAEGRIDRDDFAIAQYQVGRFRCTAGLRLQHQSEHGKNR